jgi:hypothetical protein
MLNNGLKSIHTKVGKMTTSKKMARPEEDFLSGDNIDSPRLSGNENAVYSQSKRATKNGMSVTGKMSGAKSYRKTMTGRHNLTETKNQAIYDGSYVKPWSMVSNDPVYSGSVDQSEYP